MSKCGKVKNPCKICLGPVTPKNGLQCKGACKTWMHFECLNYTPGKIKDVKAGIIKVTCPCPDCKTSEPKEYRTDQPYSCTNIQCPANRPAKCDNKECPTNKTPDKINQTSTNLIPTCPLSKCGTECKKNSHPQLPNQPPMISKPCAPPSSISGGSVEISPTPIPAPSSIEDPVSGDTIKPLPRADLSSLGTLQQMCRTVGQLANQINHLMNKMKQVVNDPEGPGFTKEKKTTTSSSPPTPQGNKTNCPKPCHCPGNPNRKK
ncbi:unnamed protein product [Parnassius mnemosyne]|uniref:PHD-type domain-containing protein n=1 Tax=Parnassius mnemosyne TaxID=213953 RepID=A0AAV1LHS5_9NEOP